MAILLPSSPPGAISTEIARTLRALKSLPDDEFIVWHRLAIWDKPGPDFLILKKGNRAAFLKVSSATSQDARRIVQPELMPALGKGIPMGVAERDELDAFSKEIINGSRLDEAKTIPALIVYPNLQGEEVRDALRARTSNGTLWISGELMRSERLLGFFESNLSKPLSNDELARIRVTFTPEVLIPSEFTVRKPIERNTEAELTDFLLDYDQEWLLKCDLDLSDEAKRTSQDFGVRLVNGVAGSGKSLIIVYRALLLRRLFPQKRILVLTHNRPLIQDLEARYKVLSNGDHGVEWRTFLSWCLSLYPNDIEAGDRIGKTTREKLMREIWNDHLCETALTPSMLESEIDWFKDRLLSKRSDYIVADRTGRGFALQESMRSRIYEAMVDYSGRLSQRGLIDWGDVPRQLWGMIDSRELDLPQYDVILVDEAQFFAPIWFELIKKLIHPVTGHLFLVADPTQGFLNRGQSWLSSGLEVRGRSHRLDRSYRTTRQILDFAIYLYRSRVPLDEEDIVVPNLLDMPDGVLPVILPMTSPQDEITRVVNEINELVQAKVPKGQILVIHSDWTGVDAIIDRLNTVLGADSAVDPKDEHHGDQIRVCTLNAVTGLESPIVFLVGLHLLYEHEQSLRISDEERVELVRDNTRKIYMAITRAGQRVVITYSGEIPGWLRINPGS